MCVAQASGLTRVVCVFAVMLSDSNGCFDEHYSVRCVHKCNSMRPRIRKDSIRRMLKRGSNALIHPTHDP